MHIRALRDTHLISREQCDVLSSLLLILGESSALASAPRCLKTRLVLYITLINLLFTGARWNSILIVVILPVLESIWFSISLDLRFSSGSVLNPQSEEVFLVHVCELISHTKRGKIDQRSEESFRFSCGIHLSTHLFTVFIIAKFIYTYARNNNLLAFLVDAITNEFADQKVARLSNL